jgi:DNA-binding PadR family transcriptional regulator
MASESDDSLAGLGRFTEPAVLVLASLAGGPKHGYAIIQDVRVIAGHELGPGTLYGALARLEQQGLIEALPAEDRRRPYRLTGAGASALERRLSALEQIARVGLRRLQGATA